MSYCRWLEGDLYAYKGHDGFHVLVAARSVTGIVRSHYVETTAHALLARVLWLGFKGCDYPWDALRYLKEDIIEEMEKREQAKHDSETAERD